MLGDLSAAIILAVVLSLVIATIEVRVKSEADLLICVSGFFFVYFLILAFGNSLTTLIASTFLAEFLPNEGLGVSDSANLPTSSEASKLMTNQNALEGTALTLPGPPWFWYGAVGVFGFEAILKNMNVTMFDKGVLTINDWIQRARDVAVADAIKSQAEKKVVELQELARRLTNRLSDKELITHAASAIGNDEMNELIQKTEESGGDKNLALALAIASNDVDSAKGIIKAARKVTKP